MNFLVTKFFWGVLRHVLSDKWYAKIRYRLELDRWPDLQNPQLFTEKIQYIKLYERTNIRKQLADRMGVRSYVAKKAGEEYLIPLIGHYDKLTSSVWQSLPKQFVLKANHGCGMVNIVRNKNEEEYASVYRQTEEWKGTNYYKIGREWVYKNLSRTIVAEQLLLTSINAIPKDYKFFCFNGKVEVIQVDYDRFEKQKRNLFNRDFNRIKGTLLYPNYEGSIQRPHNIEKAIEVAEALAADLNFIRVDLYILKNQIYFGELTNYPGDGFVPFQPKELEYKMGALLQL